MKKIRGLVTLLALACSSAGYTADSPLGMISNEADVVIRIKSFDGTVEKVAALANAVQPGTGDLVSQNATAFGLVISNPAMAGVDRSKDFYLCLFVRGQGEPKALFAIPATDGEALAKALPPNFESQVRENWVFYADKDHGVPEAASASDSLAEVLEGDEGAAKVFDSSDIGLHVNIDHIAKVYDSQLKQGRQLFETQLEQGINTPGVSNAKAVVGVLKAEMDLAFKLLDETETLTLGISPSGEGLVIDNQLEFAEGSEVAQFINRQPKSKFAGLSKLKSDQPIYLGMSGDFNDVGRLGMQLAGSMFEGTGMKEGMEKYMSAMSKAGGNSAMTSLDVGGGNSGLIRSTILFETKGASELQAAGREMYSAIQEMKFGEMTTKVTVAKDSETIGSRKVDVVTTTQEIDSNNPGAETLQKMNKLLYGEGGIQTRITSLKDCLLMTQGGGKESMESALKAYDSSSNSLADVRKDLPEECHLLVLMDLPGLIYNGMLAATAIPDLPVPFQRPAVEELQITRSYASTTAVGGDDALRVTTRIPASQFQGTMKLIMFLRSVH